MCKKKFIQDNRPGCDFPETGPGVPGGRQEGRFETGEGGQHAYPLVNTIQLRHDKTFQEPLVHVIPNQSSVEAAVHQGPFP